jgi:signal transduction histidine kinase
MTREGSTPTREELERELARLAEERHELFARLVELESERTQQTIELFTMAAHELRSPLQSLVMGTDLMVDRVRESADELSPRWLLGHLERQQMTLTQMGGLMESWLRSPSVRAGTMPSAVEQGDLADMVRLVVARYDSQLAWAGCRIELKLESVIGLWDRVRIESVVGNLLSNAIKYGAGKPVVVSVAGEREGAKIVVKDDGIGISAADQKRIFERFERASTPSRVPGFGIGLWMTRALLRAIGGAIDVESKPGSGSTFTIRLRQDSDD